MDAAEKRLEIAVEAVKQQITLATAILAALLALSDKVKPTIVPQLWIALVPLSFSVLMGVLVLLSISFYLAPRQDPFQERGVRVLGTLQCLSFLGAVFAMVYLACM
jgi:hypothetical protein